MKKLAAIALVFALLFCFTACGNTPDTQPTSEDNSSAQEVTEEVASVEGEEVSNEETLSEEAATDEITTVEETEAVTEEPTTEASAVPQTEEEILAFYNDAVKKAYDAKVGFSKKRYTDNEVFDMSLALKAFKGIVEKFVGIGSDNVYTADVAKGNWGDKELLVPSKLTMSDLKGAEIKESGDNLIVTLKVKGGNSTGNKNTKTNNAPIDKCGICVGDTDKGYYDHKTGPVIYDAIGGAYASAKINESYSNAKVYATIDAKTGEISNLKVECDIEVFIDLGIGKGTATGLTHIIYSNFDY